MLVTKAAGYSRTFYLAAVVIWTGATALMFITAVWGGFYGMMDAVMSAREAKHLAENLPAQPMTGTTTPVHLETNPFEQKSEPQAPAGWAVTEVSKALHYLELRPEKLTPYDSPPAAPAAPATSAPPAAPAVESNVVKETITAPAPKKEPAGPPLMAGELGVVQSVSFDPAAGRFTFTAKTTAPPQKVTYFFLDNPRRLAVDLQGAWRYTAQRSADFTSGPIARAAVGEHPDYVRITLHFRDPKAAQPADPVITKLKDGYSVSLTSK